jgi:glycosyltransferase involved in cell wall biosynthesis
MTMGKALCLNMIVKNETANLDRCLRAVADHITCWVIGDTGSTDGTQNFIKSFFADRGIPGELHSFPFLNFEQARNAALDHAAASELAYDYILLADADMELMVEDRDFRAKLEAPGYRLIQRTDSGLTYSNTRLVRRNIGARYHGVTHEYIDVPGGVEELQGVWYKDHASGSNRADKFERDIRLLSKALKHEPENHRYWFYLAQSYRDAGQRAKAAQTYAKRAEMGGWDEEAWYARLQQARCLRDLKDEGGFIREALAAFNQRPQRAEPLYDLARFYRECGMNAVSVLFSEFGLTLPRPEQDILFLEDFVYEAGLHEEYSIAANYACDPARKDRGRDACNWLALNRKIPAGNRNLARSNLLFYVESASTMMPSFVARPVGFTPPDGYQPTNPSVARWGEQIMMVQRTVNYIMTGDNQYETPNGAPIHTRNFLLRLDPALDIQSSTEILPPADMPEPLYKLVKGFEDMRLFAWAGQLWCSSNLRELTAEGWCEQVLARIDQSASGDCRLTDWRVLRPEGPRLHEKNWMPLVDDDRLQFIYLCDPTRILDEQARTVAESVPAITAEQFRGGSQAIPFDGGWLALIHEVLWWTAPGRRSYQHRFVWLDKSRIVRGVSRAFFFHEKAIEFAAGLAWHPDRKRLMVSFSVGDHESRIATVDANDVRSVLVNVKQLPSGSPGARARVPITVALRDASEPTDSGQRAQPVDPATPASIEGLVANVSDGIRQRAIDEESAAESASLASIFDRWGTDKAANGYADFYDCLFRKDRRQIEAVLEIGIGTMIPGVHSSMAGYAKEGYKPGGSLRSWAEFFSNAIVYGADVQPDTQFNDNDQIVTVLCDSTNRTHVEELAKSLNYKKFDIIIDDGSHLLDDQLATLANFFPYLKENGTYIVEDIAHNGLVHHVDKIKAICGESPLFFAGPQNNPLVIKKRTTVAQTNERYLELAPFLRAVDSPADRKELSRALDQRVAQFLGARDTTTLPRIHCFYEVLSDTAQHHSLIAATASMRAAGHPVQVWSYSPQKLDFLAQQGIEVRPAEDVMPRGLFERIVAGSEIRYFSDIFRYAALYEHGGLWMDTDVVLLRPFPYGGDYFLNLQWRGGHKGHFVCGNVMYATPHSRHLRTLYERSLDHFFQSGGKEFGDIGPKLLSDYVMSDAGAELRGWLFSPMLFNAIDWTEIEKFNQPIAELADYLSDERVFGVHLWNARTNARSRDEDASLIALLSDPIGRLPTMTILAERFNTDKNRHTGNRHFYSRIYDKLLSARRFSLRRLMEIGLCRGLAEQNQTEMPSVELWQTYFPFCHVIGVDLTDFSRFNNERLSSLVCDQSKPDQLRAVAASVEPGSLDVIIDDGSHASFDQQATLREFFPLLADGGWYFIEDLDWQPPGEDRGKITPTKDLLREIQGHGTARSIDPMGIGDLSGQISQILFFDSHYELNRATLLGGLVAIRKRGGAGFV